MEKTGASRTIVYCLFVKSPNRIDPVLPRLQVEIWEPAEEQRPGYPFGRAPRLPRNTPIRIIDNRLSCVQY